MSSFLLYLLRATIVSGLFYGVYRLLLGRTTFYRLNRAVLLMVMTFCWLLPLFPLDFLPDVFGTMGHEAPNIVLSENTVFVTDSTSYELPEPSLWEQIPWESLLWGIYWFGFGLSVLYNLFSLGHLWRMIARGQRTRLQGHDVRLLQSSCAPFSWWRIVVLGTDDLLEDVRPVLLHEEAHVQLWHSADRLYFDLFVLLFWFNPVARLLRHELKMLHEYQADRAVLTQGIDTKAYQLLLIRKSAGRTVFSLANNLLRCNLHKRIKMMMTQETKQKRGWSYLLLLPAAFVAVLLLSVPGLRAEKDLPETESVELLFPESDFTIQNPQKKEVRVYGKITLNGKPSGDVKIEAIGFKITAQSTKDGHFSIYVPTGSTLKFSLPTSQSAGKDISTFYQVGDKGGECHVNISMSSSSSSTKTDVTRSEDIEGIELVYDADEVEKIVNEAEKMAEEGRKKTKDNKRIAKKIKEISGEIDKLTDERGKKIKNSERIAKRIEKISEEIDKIADEEAVQHIDNKSIIISTEELTGENLPLTRGQISTIVLDNEVGNLDLSSSNVVMMKDPLFILDGKEISKEQLKAIASENIVDVTVLKDDKAVELYGSKGKNGVVSVRTKGKNGKKSISPHKKSIIHSRSAEKMVNPLIILDGKEMPNGYGLKDVPSDHIADVTVLKGDKAVELYGSKGKNGVVSVRTKGKNGKKSISPHKKSIIHSRSAEKMVNPLIILDGKEMPNGYGLKDVPSDHIADVTVLKSDKAVELYGSKGKNGVVVVKTKK